MTLTSNDGTDRLAHHIDHERIAARAYELYQSHGGAGGSADDDWQRAEAEYRALRETRLSESLGRIEKRVTA